MTDRYELKITSAIVIDGAIRKAGSVVTVDERTAKDFLRRGKAELVTAPAEPQAAEAKADEAGNEGAGGDDAEVKPKAGGKKAK